MHVMKPVRHSVALVVRDGDGRFLVVKRPNDPDDKLAGVWGFPAVTAREGEDERTAAIRTGTMKLGVEVSVDRKIGESSADRGGHVLHLAEYEAAIARGTPSVPQPDRSVTQYVEYAFTHDPAILYDAARKGSLCARIYLTSIGRDWAKRPWPPVKRRPSGEMPRKA
jgi:8-oxo-dGTP diphosphatase